MKNYYNHKLLLLLSVILLVAVSCKNSYEPEPLEKLSGDYVWDTQDSLGTNAEKFLTNIYTYLPTGFNRVGGEMLDAATDDAVSPSLTLTAVTRIAQGGGYDLFGNEEFSDWSKNYAGIRQANIFLKNVDVVPLKFFLPDGRPVKQSWKAEARFLRAFFYFEMVKRYGGVPLVGDEVKEITDNVLIPRNTFGQCVDYIVGECDAIKDSLRADLSYDNTYGRITKGAALALKARVLLYAASPLFNHQGSAGLPSGPAASQGVSWYPDYSAERWLKAANAAEDIIRYNKFGLMSRFDTVFITRNNEVIFSRVAGPNTDIEKGNGPVGFVSPNDASGKNTPTWELFSAFPTINGLSITEDPAYNPTTPTYNRDSRLYSTILFHGSLWLNTPLQTFDGGTNKPASNIAKTNTSFYLRKFMGMFETSSNYASTLHNFIYFRYAEVLLNYAEATNEYSGPSPSVEEALIALRKRAKINEGTDGRYGLKPNMTKDEMREAIRLERRLELAFEEHRYWDTRRWLIAQKVLTGNQHGLKLLRSNAGDITQQLVVVRTANFGGANRYLYPIPYSELTRNDKLIQNPGW